MYVPKCVYLRTFLRTYVPTYAHTRIRIHTYINTQLHTIMHTYWKMCYFYSIYDSFSSTVMTSNLLTGLTTLCAPVLKIPGLKLRWLSLGRLASFYHVFSIVGTEGSTLKQSGISRKSIIDSLWYEYT